MTQGRIIGRGGGEFPDGYWQTFRWMPHPKLALHVRGYNGYSKARLDQFDVANCLLVKWP